MSDLERRKLRDAAELRVLAHPLRLRILQVLRELGSATATELAERVGESPANCSWHLRQLAKHRFVEETGERKGRQRPWRPVSIGLEWGSSQEPSDVATAGDELDAMLMEQEFAGLRSWLTWKRTDPPRWQDAVALNQSTLWLTVEELADLRAEFDAVIERYRDRINDPAARPSGARRIRMFAWAVPAEPLRAD
jgi:DNA-binding transcriptional ArsR family regulator